VFTTVFLVRPGATSWHRDRKVVGHRDIPLSDEGQAQADAASLALADIPLNDIITSPLARAVQTAETLARSRGGAVNRDPRLIDLRVGSWEGRPYDEVAASPEYKRLVANPLGEKLPGGEDLGQVRDRAVASLNQALRDAPAGEALAVVTHAAVCRVLLCHYLGGDLASWTRLHVVPGSISALRFRDDREPPRVDMIGWRPSLKEVLSNG
jgi:broad specificity phosphatase PhoE